MKLEDVFSLLQASHVQLWVEGAQLKYRAPTGAMTEDLRAMIAVYRDKIIDHLRQEHHVRTRCNACDWRLWVDSSSAESGLIRTTCGRCGRFIGYRPAILARSGQFT